MGAHHNSQEDVMVIGQYELDVMEAKQIHDIMTRDPWVHYQTAKRAYEEAKRQADESYLKRRHYLFGKLEAELGTRKHAERANNNVERNLHPGDKPANV